ncbi:MAG: hypothetical protein ACR2O2_01835 [Ruegeria sp.]
MQPLFIATKKFGPWNDQDWQKYVGWSGLTQLAELVSLDGMLCPTLLGETKDEYWPYIVNEDYMLDFFVDLEFMLEQLPKGVEKNLLCVFRNPATQPAPPDDSNRFELLGYELLDVQGGISALTNCGGFPEAFSNEELNQFGLISSRDRAVEVQASLRAHYPDAHHADCHVWALTRASNS